MKNKFPVGIRSFRWMMTFWLVLLLPIMGMACADNAQAHALVIKAQPEAGSTIAGETIDVTVMFNTRIDPERSRLSLRDAKGMDRPFEGLPSTEADANALSGKLTNVAPGRYRIHWQVLALDGHFTEGDIPITVAP